MPVVSARRPPRWPRSRRPGWTWSGWPRPTGSTGPASWATWPPSPRRWRSARPSCPIYTRTPTLIAMTAAGIDTLSDGRFHLGLGSSGPQVIEGWHGVPVQRAPSAAPGRSSTSAGRSGPARRRWSTRARYYTMPLPRGQGTGLARPSRSSPIRCARRSPSGWPRSGRRTWP